MDNITFELKGLNEVLNNFKQLDKKIQKQVKDEINASALKIQSDAKKLAPVNFGKLRGSIFLTKISNQNEIIYSVGTNLNYAPYVEFGTGGKVSVPAGYEDYAMQFKGQKSGTYYDFLMAIVEWIKNKGIRAGVYNIKTKRRIGNKSQKFDEDVRMAERIAFSILKKGIRPQPFLLPAFEQEKPKLINRLENVVKNAQS
jgi:HK97 gp10 family phage protein